MHVVEQTETRLRFKQTSPLTPGCAVVVSALVLTCPTFFLYTLIVHREYLAQPGTWIGVVVAIIWVLLAMNLLVVPLTTTYTFDKMLGTGVWMPAVGKLP